VDLHDGKGTAVRFRTYAADVSSVLGQADRIKPFEYYCIGPLSVEAARVSSRWRR
jgi:SRSO17 transposase